MKRKCYTGFLLALSLFLSVIPVTETEALTSQSIKEMESQISNAEKEKKELQNSLSDIKGLLKKLEGEKRNLKNYVAELDANLEKIQDNVSALKIRIQDKEKEIETTNRQLESAKETESSQYEAMSSHIKYSYVKGPMYQLGVLLKGGSLGTLLSRMVYMNSVARYDDDMLNLFIETRKFIEVCEENLKVEKELLDEAKEGLEKEQEALETLIKEKQQEISKYDSSIAGTQDAIAEYQAYIAEQNEIIKQLEAAVAEERRKLVAQNQSVLTYDGGVFKFPLASYTRISDDYGNRIHPTLGVQQFHNGVDFAAPSGTAIYAAYSGVVVAATYSSTMGNYVMIDHGDGLYTIYMHASKLYVSKDAVVARGDTIAAVGSTGRSTGPHLHFSVRKGGEYTSPWNYLSQ